MWHGFWTASALLSPVLQKAGPTNLEKITKKHKKHPKKKRRKLAIFVLNLTNFVLCFLLLNSFCIAFTCCGAGQTDKPQKISKKTRKPR